ncbi:MAG: hypothetical protein EBS85_03510 [Micrococcales bacterium]|nr:hypothetical protein [Actinomycetota bacterium]NCA07778.1 hypothetical protein [Micrococcales bacterium]
MENLLTTREIKLLGNQVGSNFSNLAGPTLWHHLTSPLVYITTEDAVIALEATCEEIKFGQDWLDISKISVNEADISVLEACFESGNVYKKFAGQEIISVSLVKDKITGALDGVPNFDYACHSAIAFQFAEGYLLVSLEDHNLPMMSITYQENLNLETLPKASNEFEEDLNQHFNYHREIEVLRR